MNESIEQLIGALREELQQYGEMLALLEQQRHLVVQRSGAALLENLAAINGQTSVIQVARREREQFQSQLSLSLQLPADARFSSLLGEVPEPYRGLVKTLVDEINQCLRRVQQRARQNHLLLSCSIEMMQRFMATLFPSSSVTTYNQSGRASAVTNKRPGLYEVVG
ncbi:MAG: flagellar protein FlgN [Verrucomicrobiia bacterium]|jgi:flagellar biosynthesis/type III secretory pathway chaperone